MLSDMKIKALKAGDKQQKHYDGNGLFLIVSTAGNKLWRFKYRFAGKEKSLTLGQYPIVGLSEARKRRDEARDQVKNGIDPSSVRKANKNNEDAKLDNSFGDVANEWMQKKGGSWSEGTLERYARLLLHDLGHTFTLRPINEIKAPELLNRLRKIEDKGTIDTAHRARQAAGMVFRYGIATGRCERDISADLKGALATHTKQHRAALIEIKDVRRLAKSIDAFDGTRVVRAALQLSMLFFQRPGEIRTMKWEQVDFEKKEWRFLSTKKDKDHIVPLANQAIAILKDLHAFTGKRGPYVFPSARGADRPLSDGAVLVALRSMGFDKHEMSAHGFRATARTLLDEELEIRTDFIEHQLAHQLKDPNGRAYNRTAHLLARRDMMQRWADYLDKLKSE